MDNTNHTTEHRKGQHLLNEERHEIEVRLKDGWTVYRIAKHLGRPYNTIKNEIKDGTREVSNEIEYLPEVSSNTTVNEIG